MDLRNNDDNNLFVPSEMNKTTHIHNHLSALSIFTYYFKM